MAEAEDDDLTPAEIRDSMNRELRNMKREFQLREKQATELLAACEGGSISVGEANRRFLAYYDRWGDAFRGFLEKTEGLSDEELLRMYDRERRRHERGSSFGFER